MTADEENAQIDALALKAAADLQEKFFAWRSNWPEFGTWTTDPIGIAADVPELSSTDNYLATFHGRKAQPKTPASQIPTEQRAFILEKMKERIP